MHSILESFPFELFPLAYNSKRPPSGLPWKRWVGDIESHKGNIGVRTGVPFEDGFLFVVDVDYKGKNPLWRIERFEEIFWDVHDIIEYPIPKEFVVRTPSGGLHFYCKTRHSLRNSQSVLGDCIDTRGEGGYVVAPGSRIDKNYYKVVVGREIPFLPLMVEAYMRTKMAGKDNPLNHVAPVPKGNEQARIKFLTQIINDAPTTPQGKREATIFAFCCRCKNSGLGTEQTLELAIKYNSEKMRPPLNLYEIKRKVKNAFLKPIMERSTYWGVDLLKAHERDN